MSPSGAPAAAATKPVQAAFATLALSMLAVAAGCRAHEPQPLDEQAVREALRVPAGDALRARASELSHPLLPPTAAAGSRQEAVELDIA